MKKIMFNAFALAASMMIGGVAFAQTSAFSYQGQLKTNGSLANGTYDFVFTLYNAANGGGQVGVPFPAADLNVSNGLFTTVLDFGSAALDGALYMEIAVRPGASSGSFTALTPRQRITSAPFAFKAATLDVPATLSASSGSPILTAINSDPNGGLAYIGGTTNAVYGSTNTSSGNGVRGVANTGASAYGVWGQSTSGLGVVGDGFSTGVRGIASKTTEVTYGVYGETKSNDGFGVYGKYSNSSYGYLGGANYGVFGRGNIWGVYGETSYYDPNANNGAGIYGKHTGSVGFGVRGDGPSAGVAGYSSQGNALYGYGDTGVQGQANGDGYGVYGVIGGFAGSYAGFFSGRVHVNGTLTANNKQFKIDHPLDPANKYLVHNCIESDEMLNLYTGNITLDQNGESMVQLPDWFTTVNKDFRYQLTCIGGFANVYVKREVDEAGRFFIAGGSPGLKVSWTITGVRQDPYAKAHPLTVEEEKPENEKGSYLNPELYDQPETLQVDKVRERNKRN